MKYLYIIQSDHFLESEHKSRFVWFWQNSEARAVVLSGQLPLQLGQQAVAVHQAGEEEEQSETRFLPIECLTTVPIG